MTLEIVKTAATRKRIPSPKPSLRPTGDEPFKAIEPGPVVVDPVNARQARQLLFARRRESPPARCGRQLDLERGGQRIGIRIVEHVRQVGKRLPKALPRLLERHQFDRIDPGQDEQGLSYLAEGALARSGVEVDHHASLPGPGLQLAAEIVADQREEPSQEEADRDRDDREQADAPATAQAE